MIATDIDYAEVGGEKGMLMRCMSAINALEEFNTRIEYLNNLKEK